MQLNKPKDKYTQRGNVVIFILIAVFLFGTLTYTFTRSARDGSSNISRQQAKIVAQEFLAYANNVQRAVDKLRRNGCSEEELNFTNEFESAATYNNPDSPGDNSCHIFEPEGGNVTASLMNPSVTEGSPRPQYRYTGAIPVEGIGVLEKAEIMIFQRLTKDNTSTKAVCDEINKLVGNDTTFTSDALNSNNASGFKGKANLQNNMTAHGGQINSANLIGKPTGCGSSGSHGQIYFPYHVLIER